MSKPFFKKEKKTTCSKCGAPLDRPKQSYCKKCHSETMREHRIKAAEELKMLREFYKLHHG
jgi:predicted amidophosphoribosyltransferase